MIDKNWELFEDLKLFDISSATAAYVLGVREYQIWKWSTGQIPIPLKYRKKLAKLIQRMEKSPLLSR